MVILFANNYLEALYRGVVLKGKPRYSSHVITKFAKTVKMVMLTDSIRELSKFKSLNFEALKGDFKGKYSVRVDYKYRLIFRVEKNEVVIEDVIVIEDLTNHYQ